MEGGAIQTSLVMTDGNWAALRVSVSRCWASRDLDMEA